jgi:CHAT domain-containing protein
MEERLILSAILAKNSQHIATYSEANSLFKLAQFLNRDKGKLGLNESALRQELKSDLRREDYRTRDRLSDLRDEVMDQATQSLLGRILPIRGYVHVTDNDYGFLLRLEDIEDKIASANDQLEQSDPEFFKRRVDSPINLSVIQQLIQPSEALVIHNIVTGIGLVTTCVDSKNWTFNFAKFEKSAIQQLMIDEKLVSAAVHGTHEPSATLDSSFPVSNSHRLYQLFFGGIEACLNGKTHILLATDADFFSLPWNALLVKLPDHQVFQFRDASWLPKFYALSLLPLVRSIYQLRATRSTSRAHEKFLGIGDPDFRGKEHLTPLTLAPLFASRGVANKAAIRDLPALPESANELRVVADALGASNGDLLLGSKATERVLRQHQLDDYRVISFATHAIVAGEIEGVTEPALVLSPGQEGSNAKNDGLLTMSKIANLTLDANLIVLSACNTAASDGHASGRGLSGLADAFFFAGARAVAVTQWAVFSSVAQQLGAGLVSRSVQSSSVGVSEGIREAMVDYISSAREDYLAHPRFWGAFIIAGDGAVRPLDGAPVNDAIDKAIDLEWEHFTREPADSSITSITKKTYNNSFYSIGIEKPLPNEKRAGSYFAQIKANGNVSVVSNDRKMAASGVVSIGSEVGVLGYFPADNKSTAVFRLLSSDGYLRWQHLEDSALWNTPITIIKNSGDYILISIENDYSPASKPSTLILTLVSNQGDVLAQQRHQLSLRPMHYSARAVTLDAKGSLVIAIAGRPSVHNYPIWINPLTGTKRICTAPEATEILRINVPSLDVDYKTIVQGIAAVSLKLHVDGRVFVAGRSSVNCRLEKHVNFGELGSKLELRPIFESRNINTLEVNDMEITTQGAVLLAGAIRTFLPTALTVAVMTPEQLKKYNEKIFDFWDESIWETTEQRGSAFVLALGMDGAVLGDRVFSDLRDRSISTLVDEGSDHFIAVGSAMGDHGWAAGIRFGDQLKSGGSSTSKTPVEVEKLPQ